MEIIENQTFEMCNVLSFRGKATQNELEEKIKEIERIIEKAGAEKTGPYVTTFSVDAYSKPPIMGVEILVPLNCEIEPPNNYFFKHNFKLSNALKVRHCGGIETINSTLQVLIQYIQEHSLMAVTSAYYVLDTTNSKNQPSEMGMTIYVGVSRNNNIL